MKPNDNLVKAMARIPVRREGRENISKVKRLGQLKEENT